MTHARVTLSQLCPDSNSFHVTIISRNYPEQYAIIRESRLRIRPLKLRKVTRVFKVAAS